jgi:hypothetical protein
MTWNEMFPKATQPNLTQIDAYTGTPLWGQLRTWLEQRYGAQPRVEHSTCSGAPGWNVKYKKSGRALCTLYPRHGYFISLIAVGPSEVAEADMLLPLFSDYLQALYRRAAPMNSARWLMIEVTEPSILTDVERLIELRAKKR